MALSIKKRISNLGSSANFGLLLLLAAFLIGALFRYVGFFETDEGDKFAIGLLMARGDVIYRDIFTHHFPFTYFWVAAVIRLAPTVKAVRLSVLLFQMGSFTIAALITRSYIPIGLAALVWAVIGHLFFANMAIYNLFVGAALMVVFALTLAFLLRRIRFSPIVTLVFGVFTSIALLSDPLAIFPILVILAAVLLAPAGLKNTFRIGLVVAAILSTYIVYLVATRSLASFYQDVILFNSQIYTKYYGSAVASLHLLPDLLIKGLWIFDAGRWQLPDWLIRLGDTPQWILYLTGWFVYRLAVIVSALVLVLRKEWLAAAFIYLFAGTTLLRGDSFFRQIPFVLVALICAAWFIFDELSTPEGVDRISLPQNPEAAQAQSLLIPRSIVSFVIGGLLLWLVILTASYSQQHPNLLSYFDRFGFYETRRGEIDQAGCHQDPRLGYYPSDPMVYFYTGLEPVSKYVYLFPWVAEVGLTDVIHELQAGWAVVYVDQETNIWDYPTREYLAQLIDYLDAHYVFRQGFYLSPDLAKSCPPQQAAP